MDFVLLCGFYASLKGSIKSASVVKCWGQIKILSSNLNQNQITWSSNDELKSNGKIMI